MFTMHIRSHGIKSSHVTIVGVVFIIHVGYVNFINEAHVVLLYVFVCIFSYNNFNLIAQVLVLSWRWYYVSLSSLRQLQDWFLLCTINSENLFITHSLFKPPHFLKLLNYMIRSYILHKLFKAQCSFWRWNFV
jgi:hypothetical protein